MKNVNRKKGILLAALAVPVAIVLWVIIWRMGYIASIVAFALAWAVARLYEMGSGSAPDKKAAPFLVGLIIVGVILSFIAGVISDGYIYLTSNEGGNLPGQEAIAQVLNVLNNSSIWQPYTNDILMALVFSAIGSGWVIYDIIKGRPLESKTTKEV